MTILSELTLPCNVYGHRYWENEEGLVLPYPLVVVLAEALLPIPLNKPFCDFPLILPRINPRRQAWYRTRRLTPRLRTFKECITKDLLGGDPTGFRRVSLIVTGIMEFCGKAPFEIPDYVSQDGGVLMHYKENPTCIIRFSHLDRP